jgi:hypothetical protein
VGVLDSSVTKQLYLNFRADLDIRDPLSTRYLERVASKNTNASILSPSGKNR